MDIIKQDRRTRKTKKLYEDALIEQLKKKDINKITVKEISEAVDLNRGTFYIHYDDIYDLLDSIETKLINKLEVFAEGMPAGNINLFFEEGFTKIVKALEFIDDNKNVLQVLLKEQRNVLFLSRIKETFSNKLFYNFFNVSAKKNSKYNSIISSFLVSGFIGIIQEWIKGDKNISVFELSTIIFTMLKNSTADFQGI